MPARLVWLSRHYVRGLLLLAMAVSIAPTAGAQFGALKRLKAAKDALTGSDSAAKAKDSLAKVQAVSNGEVVALDSTKGKSMLSRATGAAVKASDKFEKVTGVSAKDAALAATGAGVAGLAAKKLGVDPTSLVGSAVNKASASAQAKVSAARGGDPIPGAALQTMQGMQAMAAMQAQARALGSSKVGEGAMLAGAQNAELLLAFQQEIGQVAMAATTGDASARAKLDAWQKMSEKVEGDAVKLSLAAGRGDAAAMTKLQQMQIDLMREWLRTYGSAPARLKAAP